MATKSTTHRTVITAQAAPASLPLPPPPTSPEPAGKLLQAVKLRVSPTGRFRIFAHPIGIYFPPDEWVEVEPHPWVLRQIQLGALKSEG